MFKRLAISIAKSCPLGKFASNRYAIKGFGSSVSSSENGEKQKQGKGLTQNKFDKEGRLGWPYWL